jgi:cephalosporin-C deacetylase-like acetyl esterase
MIKKFILSAFCLGAVLTSVAQDYSIFGNHNKPSPVYEPGEEMIFMINLLDSGKPVEGKKLKWTRTGDDGVVKEGEGISTKEGYEIATVANSPGFVRIYVTAWDENGEQLKSAQPDKKGKRTPVFFDGGACVKPDMLQSVEEPDDFDAYWAKQKELLTAVPLAILKMEEVPGNDQVVAYDVKIACPGKMPVSGYLTMPRNTPKKSLPAVIAFRGYGVSGADKDLAAGRSNIYFQINAHGIENGKPGEYYDALRTTLLKDYAFSKKENQNPDTTYFHDMFLRIMRALEFVKSLPEWNGKQLTASGGSQGGLQSLVAAGLDKDVTDCYAWSPWCCDFGRTKLGRLIGSWYIDYTPALRYYDPVNHVRRANPNCNLFIIANLGDYICPPSGVWIAYNNFPGPKKMEIRQGCEHGYTMKDYPSFSIEDNKRPE